MTREQELYDYWPIVRRPPLRWPNGARLAFWIGLNVEHFELERPSTSIFAGTATLKPDPLNYGWRDYGPRVGIWRMIELLDRCGLRASVLLNADACRRYPEIVAAGVERDWAWCAHGKNNSIFHANLRREEELAALAEMVDEIERATGRRPRGWLGPALTETYETPGLLASLGFDYLLDWCNDDQPYPLNVPGRRMISVPYSIELNDITQFVTNGITAPEFRQMIVDQFDVLHAEGAASGRVMALGLHPWIVNQPFRHRYLTEALEYVTSREGVWLATSDEIADWYLAHCYPSPENAGARR
jgi:allantoinase